MWLIWILLIALVIWAVGGLGAGGGSNTRSPRQMLDERYARGEIDDEEYRRRREAMGG